MARLSNTGNSNIPVSTGRKRQAPAGDEESLPSNRKKARGSLRSAMLAKTVTNTGAGGSSNATPNRRRPSASTSASYSTPNRAPSNAPRGTPIPESARKPTTVLPRPVPEPDSDAEDVLLIHGPSSVTRSSSKKKRLSAAETAATSSARYSSARKAHVRIKHTPRTNSSRKQSSQGPSSGEYYDTVQDDGEEDTFAFTKAGQVIRARQTSPSPASAGQPEELFFDASAEIDGADLDAGQDSFNHLLEPESDNNDMNAVHNQKAHPPEDDVSFAWPADETATTHNLQEEEEEGHLNDQTLVLPSAHAEHDSSQDIRLSASTDPEDGTLRGASLDQQQNHYVSSHRAHDSLQDVSGPTDTSLTVDLGDLAQKQQDESRLMDVTLPPPHSLVRDESVGASAFFDDEELDDEAENQEVASLLSSPAPRVDEEDDAMDQDDDEDPATLDFFGLTVQNEALPPIRDSEPPSQSSSPLPSTDGSPTLKPSAFQVNVQPPQSPSPNKIQSSSAHQLSTIEQLRQALRDRRKSLSPAPPNRTFLQPSPSIQPASETSSPRQHQHKLGSPLEEHASSARDLFTPSPHGSPEQPSRSHAKRHINIEPQKPASPPDIASDAADPFTREPVQHDPGHLSVGPTAQEEAVTSGLEVEPNASELVAEPSSPREQPLPSFTASSESEAPAAADPESESNFHMFSYRAAELSSPRGNVRSTAVNLGIGPAPPSALVSSPMQLAAELRAVHSRSHSPATSHPPENEMPPPPFVPSFMRSPSKSPRKSDPAQQQQQQRQGSLRKQSFTFPSSSSPIGSMPDMPSLSGFLRSPLKISSRERVAPASQQRNPSTSRITIEDQIEQSEEPQQLKGLLPSDSTSPMSSPVRHLQSRRSTSASHSSVREKPTSPTLSVSEQRAPFSGSGSPSRTPRRHSGVRSLADISADADREDGSDEDLMSVASNMSPVRRGDLPRSTKKLMEELTSSPSAGLMSSPASDLHHHPSPSKIFGSPLKNTALDSSHGREDGDRQEEEEAPEADHLDSHGATVDDHPGLQSPFRHDNTLADDTFRHVPRGTVANRTQVYESTGLSDAAVPEAEPSFSATGDTTVLPFPQGNTAIATSVRSHSSGQRGQQQQSGSLRSSLHRRSLSGSTIEIRSADPEIAARVAAILTQQHDYHINKDDTPETAEEKHRMREQRLQELLRKAELEVSTSQVDEHSRYGGSSPVLRKLRSPAQPRVGAANLEVPTSRHVMRPHTWSKSDWRQLEMCVKSMQRTAFEAGNVEPRPDGEDVVRRFMDELALTEDALQGHWSKQKLLYRVEALLDHRCHPKSKSFLMVPGHRDRAASTGLSSQASSVGISAYEAHAKRKDAQAGGHGGLLGSLGHMLGL